jgi:hypothetical protein
MALTPDPVIMKKVAFHEAGHAVLAWSFGVPVGGVYLDLQKESGHIDAPSHKHMDIDITRRIAFCLAGLRAEDAFTPPGRPAKAAFDLGNVWELLRESGTPKDTPEGKVLRNQGRACADKQLRKHEARVRRVAEALLQQPHKITRDQFEQLMREG